MSLVTQEIADFVSAQVIGTLIAAAFRFWAFRRWVFPHEEARPGRVRPAPVSKPTSKDEAAWSNPAPAE
ncbi:hypothetical protein [Microbispora rosea]|uniref:hypothetical protein n=1 Tax=Microbispora rosea TaxID=58117 RepID=UPI003433C2E0